jgi:metallo-beta-lactamase family protein
VGGEPEVKIHGRMIPVHASVELIESMSAHADSTEIMRWLGGFTRPPKTTYLVHGEPTAMDALAASITTRLGWVVVTPLHGQSVALA